MSEIHKFTIDGAAGDPGHILKKQAQEVTRITKRMYRKGYVPVLDIPPILEYTYLEDKQTFTYTITMYGVQVEDCNEVEGWLTGRLIPATSGTKLSRLSSPSDLMS